MEKYIAEKKVTAVVTLEDRKSPAGAVMVEVHFEDGVKEVMPKLRYELIVTDKISDSSAVQTVIQDKVGSFLYSVLHEYGAKMGEVEEILNSVTTYTNGGYEKARDLKWGVPHRYLPLIEINNVLKENYAKDNNSNGTASPGSKPN